MTLETGRESATKTPVLVALVAATKGAATDQLKALNKLWSNATKVATRVFFGRVVFLPLPLEGKDDDQRPGPLANQFLPESWTLGEYRWLSPMPEFLADTLEGLVDYRDTYGNKDAYAVAISGLSALTRFLFDIGGEEKARCTHGHIGKLLEEMIEAHSGMCEVIDFQTVKERRANAQS